MSLWDYIDENFTLTYNVEEYVAVSFFRYVDDRVLVCCKKEDYDDDNNDGFEAFFVVVKENESGEDEFSFVEGEYRKELYNVFSEITQFLMSIGEREIPVFRAKVWLKDEDKYSSEIMVVLRTFIIDNRKFNLCAFGAEVDNSYLFEVSDFERTDDDPEFNKNWKLIKA